MSKCDLHDYLYEDIKEIKTDVKKLLEYKNREEGKRSLLSNIFNVFRKSPIIMFIGGIFK